MDKRTFVGLCAALAFVAGSPGAHAIKIFDDAPANRMALMEGMDTFTYAAETLLTGDADVTAVEGDSTTYHNIGGTAALVLSAPADVGASSGNAYTVTVTLDGMVFRDAAATLAATAGTTPRFGRILGGSSGTKTVVFSLEGGSIDSAESVLNMTAMFAVSEGGGSATLTMTNTTLADLDVPGISGSAEHSGNVIKVASALKETSDPNDLTADVVTSFKKFEGGMTVGHVGSLTVGIEGHRIATSNDGADGVVDGLEDIAGTGQTTEGTTTTANSSVSFMGDFSFTEKVFVHGDGDCGAEDPDTADQGAGDDGDLATAEMDIRMMEGEGDDAVVTGTTMPVNLDSSPDNDTDQLESFVGYLCIMVQGDDTDDMEAPRIPDTTDAYTAMASYKALDMAANGPMGVERMLGEIDRNGTTVHFPFLTSQMRYNQVLRITNRGSNARYEFSSSEMDGVIEDTLMGGDMTTRLLVRDLIGDGVGEASGTLIIEAHINNIDVALVHVNRDDSSTDTWIYQ